MSWITERKRVWRGAILVLALVAILGPWVFDLIFVPAEYTCFAPAIRLDNEFCGTPLPGTWLFRWFVPALVYASKELVSGTMTFLDWSRELLPNLLLFLLVLPFMSTLLLILRGDRRRRQVFGVVAWVLAAGIGLLVGLSSYPRLFWVLWGVWLYIVLAIGALTLEVLTMAAGRRLSQG